jgi:hypothetical protein
VDRLTVHWLPLNWLALGLLPMNRLPLGWRVLAGAELCLTVLTCTRTWLTMPLRPGSRGARPGSWPGRPLAIRSAGGLTAGALAKGLRAARAVPVG